MGYPSMAGNITINACEHEINVGQQSFSLPRPTNASLPHALTNGSHTNAKKAAPPLSHGLLKVNYFQGKLFFLD